MPPRPSIASLTRFSRGLQTTAPLPPPTTPLPPSSASSSSSSALSHLPPLLSSSSSSSSILPQSIPSAINLIESQSTPSSGRYILARLHARTYLLHPKDILTVPTLKPIQSPGTALALTKVLEVGSREWSIKSPAATPKSPSSSSLEKISSKSREEAFKSGRLEKLPSLPSGLVNCQLTVLEHTKSPLQRILKKKRRKGYKKTIEHKQGWTRLRVGDIYLNPEAEASA